MSGTASVARTFFSGKFFPFLLAWNGNILTLRRTAHGKTVDNLQYHYDGNRLERLDEKVREVSREDVYEPGKEETGYYDYDFNENLIKDSGKN